MIDVRTKPSSQKKRPNGALDESALRRRSTWCTRLGLTLIVLGILAISLISFSGFDYVPFLSWLIVVSGLAEAVHAFHLRRSDEFFFHLVPGIAGIPLGLLIATHPAVGAVAWMLVFASFFTVVGLFRLISAIHLKFPSWQWAVFDSAITLLLGCLFWTTWTWLGTWFFAVAVGIALILRGFSSIRFGFSLRASRKSLPTHLASKGKNHSPAATYRVGTTNPL